MIKIGLIGVGRMGSQHLERLLESAYFKVVGCYDVDSQKRIRISEDYDVKCFDNVDELMLLCDAVDIVTPPSSHFFYAEKAIKYGKHIFVENPISNDLEEAKKIVELVREANIKFQVGHIERFNPAYLALQLQQIEPKYIEIQRLAHFENKYSDTSVVLDLMIHDIDIVLTTVKANIKNINASGVSVVSNQIDIVNARLEFDNGCVANLTASRIAQQKIRKMHFFQNELQIEVDLLNQTATSVKISEIEGRNSTIIRTALQKKYLNTEVIETSEKDALKEELNSFADCLFLDKEPLITALHSLKSLEVAHEIMYKIQKINGEFTH